MITSHTSVCSYLFIAVVVFIRFGFFLLFLFLLILLLLLVLVRQDIVEPGQVMLREDQVQHLPHDHQAQNLTEDGGTSHLAFVQANSIQIQKVNDILIIWVSHIWVILTKTPAHISSTHTYKNKNKTIPIPCV